MAYNHEYPYVDPNRYNSDWILNKIKELEGEMNTFEALNKITFSGEWDITKQYPAWTIVNDNNGRDGYISIQPVPAGVTIDNIDYWRAVANYSDVIADLQNRVIILENDVADLENYVTPEMFGAAGDGVEDDTAKVQAAIDSGKPVLLLNTYRITSSLILPNYAYIFGRGSTSALVGDMDDGTPVLYQTVSLGHLTLRDFLISGNHKDNIGIQLDNPYDNCEIRNIFFLNMVNCSIKCGNANDVSQGLLIDNCMCWYSSTNANSGSNHIFEFEKCNEFNIHNSKLLYDGSNRGTTQNMLATNCMDMLVTGCSFANTTEAAVQFTGGQSRYCRMIGNTYELVDGGSNSAIIELIGTVADAIQNFMIIEQPYYNCPANVFHTNSSQHIIVGLATTGGRRNLSINNKGGSDPYGNMNLIADGNMLESERFGVKSGANVKGTLGVDANGYPLITCNDPSCTFSFGYHIDCSRPGGGLKLRDANGNAYYVIVNTSGVLQVIPG